MKKNLFLALLISLPITAKADEVYGQISGGDVELESGSRKIDDNYFRISLGIQLSDHISLESGLWDLGGGRDQGTRISAKTIYAGIKVGTELSSRLELYGRTGIHHWDRDIGSDDEDGRDLFFGIGIGFATPLGQFAAEIHRLNLDAADATTFGIAYRIPLGL